MVFSSMLFLWIFLPLVLAAYYISPGKIRNGILVFFSLLFYAWGEPLYVFLMLFSVAVNFTGGILIEKYQTRKKKILVATLIINLGLLGYFKYFGTLTEAITGLFSADGTGTTLFQVALPIGISFYTFQALSYVIDVYRGEVPAQHNFWHMLLYISFFPQLIAGPIVKYRDIAAQITGRKETIRKFAAGIMRFCWGLGKKVLLANSFARVVDEIFKYGPYAVSRKALWLGAILYMMQIYYDFPDIPIWPLVLEKCSDLNSRRISIILIQLVLCRNSGTDGIFPCLPGFAIMSIFLWEEIAKARHAPIETCLLYFSLPECGMGLE